MKQDYFIVVFAHSLHGRLRRIHIPNRFVHASLAAILLLLLLVAGAVGSYARMLWKIANYNSLEREAQVLRDRYEALQKKVKQTNEQLASLQVLADEVTTAYGVKKQLAGSPDLIAEAPLIPTMHETLAEFNYLRTTNFALKQPTIFMRSGTVSLPSIWPVNGPLMSGFGVRMDPFSGEGAMHSGVDISAPRGTPVKAAADGIVVRASWYTGYGRCVMVDHGNNYTTIYGHLSHFNVIEGQEIRRGDIVGQVGISGRSTGAHLHYEVRIGSTPVNPYRFLSHQAAAIVEPAAMAEPAADESPF